MRVDASLPRFLFSFGLSLMRGSRVVDHAGDGILVEEHFKQHLDAMFGLSDAEMDRCAALPAEPVQAVGPLGWAMLESDSPLPDAHPLPYRRPNGGTGSTHWPGLLCPICIHDHTLPASRRMLPQ